MPKKGVRVEAHGSKDARYVLVGEAPGEQEAEHGRPFYEEAAAGEVLWRILGNLGVPRRQCYTTNVIKEWPGPGNPITDFWSSEYGFTFKAEPYLEELREELAGTKANVIVALGNPALEALTGQRPPGISVRRGSTYEAKGLPGARKVLACIHPVNAARLYLNTWVLTFDFQKMIKEAHYPEVRRPQRDIQIASQVKDAVRFMQLLYQQPDNWVGVDIEKIDDRMSSIAFSPHPSIAYVVPFLDTIWDSSTRESLLMVIKPWLEDPNTCKVFHNCIYDMTELLRTENIRVRGPIEDTMIRQHLLYPDLSGKEERLGQTNPIGGKRLAFITSLYTDEPYYKDEGHKWKTFGDFTAYFNYNAKDAAIPVECLPLQRAKSAKTGQDRTYERTMRAVPNVQKMMLRGIAIDHAALGKLQDRLDREIRKKQNALDLMVREVSGNELEFVNPNSPQQVADYFYRVHKVRKLTRKGKETTDKTALRRIAAKGYKEALLMLAVRELRKTKGTYANIALDPDGRFRYSVNLCGTKTSRMSTEATLRKTGGNIQNQPPEVRHIFVPDEGRVMASVDLEQAEFIIVAHRTQDPGLLDAVKGDAHQHTADLLSRLLGKRVPRKRGKTCNFAFNYGMSAQGFMLEYTVPLEQAKIFREGYLKIYPGIVDWWESVRAQLATNSRTMENCFGRRRKFLERWGEGLWKEAYDWEPQSTVGDLLIDAFADSRMNGIDILAPIHDEVLFQCLPEQLDDHVATVMDVLQIPLSIGGDEFTIPTGVKIGYSWGDLKEVPKDMLPSETLGEMKRG